MFARPSAHKMKLQLFHNYIQCRSCLTASDERAYSVSITHNKMNSKVWLCLLFVHLVCEKVFLWKSRKIDELRRKKCVQTTNTHKIYMRWWLREIWEWDYIENGWKCQYWNENFAKIYHMQILSIFFVFLFSPNGTKFQHKLIRILNTIQNNLVQLILFENLLHLSA